MSTKTLKIGGKMSKDEVNIGYLTWKNKVPARRKLLNATHKRLKEIKQSRDAWQQNILLLQRRVPV